ncbi:MAG: hypothetical protein EA344_08195 [Alkalicoccus sp.]|nr:MAG: hypothetical protein EA344_08195 [Alkalicoccus sp.]
MRNVKEPVPVIVSIDGNWFFLAGCLDRSGVPPCLLQLSVKRQRPLQEEACDVKPNDIESGFPPPWYSYFA